MARLRMLLQDAALSVGLALVATFLVTGGVALGTMEGPSMMPTLADPSWYASVSTLQGRVPVARDAIVVVEHRGGLLVKRAVGVGGDVIEMRGGQVYRNGTLVAPRTLSASGRGVHDLAPQRVPPGHVFVLGDALAWSVDSRDIGTLSVDQVRAVVIAHGPSRP